MKINNIFKMLSCAAVALLATACADTDAQYTIPNVDSPVLVSTTPSADSVLVPGKDTIKVTFNKNIFFYSGNASKITVNGESAISAKVYGSDSVLTVVANVPAEETITLNIPEGLVTGPNKTPAGEINQTWKGIEIKIATELANTNANADAQSLYSLLLENYGKKILSGTMADVNWNTTPAEAVHTLTGKYPAIACFDYIHIPYSGQNWIDYDDLTPVTDWHDKGGIVANMWHWLVPTQGLSADVTTMTSGWGASIQLTDDASKAILANAKAGDKIVVHYKKASSAQGSFKGSDWGGLKDGDGTSYDYFDIGSSYATFGKCDITGCTYTLTLDATLADVVKSGVIITGHDYEVESVNYVAKDAEEMTYRPDETTFSVAKILTEGTLENKTMKRDLAEIATRLKALQSKGISVLWRPLHEASGNTENYTGGTAWFWWGADGATTYKKLWQYMFTYFQEQGVNNLVWVWTGAYNDSNWYPGDNYVDVVGADIYNVTKVETNTTTFSKMQQTYPHKMITLSECGAISKISDMLTAGAYWSWFMPWTGNYDDNTPQASDEWWQDAAGNSNVLMLDDLK